MYIHLKVNGAILLHDDADNVTVLGNVNKSTAYRIIVMNFRLDPRDAGDIVSKLERAIRAKRERVIQIDNVSSSNYSVGNGHSQSRTPFNSSGSGARRGISRERNDIYTRENQSRKFVSR